MIGLLCQLSTESAAMRLACVCRRALATDHRTMHAAIDNLVIE